MKTDSNIPKGSFLDRDEEDKGLQLLQEAEQLFKDRRQFLEDRQRAFKFMFGEQWSDKMKDPDTGKTITEEEFIRNDGRVPIKNNLIGKMVRNLIGQYRQNSPDPVVFARNRDDAQVGEKMTSALQAALDKNQSNSILDPRQFEEFMVSAGFGWKIGYHWWDEMDSEDVRIDPIDQTRFFFNVDSQDPRMFDVSACGELHDMDFEAVISKFAQTPSEVEDLRSQFPWTPDESYYSRYPEYIQEHRNFYLPDNQNQVRVIEYWKKEWGWMEFIHDTADATYTSNTDKFFAEQGLTDEEIASFSVEELIAYINEARVANAAAQGIPESAVRTVNYKPRYEARWKAYWITPLGHILHEMWTPYEHQGNPYIFGLYPLMDGRTMSLVTSIIDQQKFVNRIIQMVDKGMGQSIQNLMWVPVDYVPEGMERSEFAEQATVHNGMMFYVPKDGVAPPQPIKTHATVVGQFEMLQIMQEYLENISSVNDAIQGQDPGANTPASLYAQRVNNAAIGNKDYFDTFFSIVRRRNRRVVQLIQQYYEEPRYIRVAGSGFNGSVNAFYDPEDVRGIDFDVAIGETQDTLAYRQTVDNYLMEFLSNQFITFEEFLQTTSMPFADQLLEKIQSRAQNGMGAGGAGQGVPPELISMLQQQMGEKQQALN